MKYTKILLLILLFSNKLLSYNEFDSVIQNHLDSVVFTPVYKDSAFIVGFDKEDKSASIGLRLKNKDSFLYSNKQGLFGTIGSSQLDFGHIKTHYLSFVRDREDYTIEATLAYSPASSIYSYDTLFGQTSDVYGGALRTTYNFINTNDIKWDISYSLPIFLINGNALFTNQNCITDEFNRSICEEERVNLKTELPQHSIETRFFYQINDTLSFDSYFEYVKNVAYTNETRYLGRLGLNYKFDFSNPTYKKDFNFFNHMSNYFNFKIKKKVKEDNSSLTFKKFDFSFFE